MITDARVLQPEFVPNDVVHRDSEINYLSSTLDPLTRGKPADPSFLHGPPGTGKTCIAQYTLEKLCENLINVNTQYVNCWEDYSKFKTLYRILEGIDKTLDIHRQSTPTDELLERLQNYNGPPYVVILDEVDQLEDKNILYDLYRTKSLTMILVANHEEEFFSQLNSRLRSRLQTSARIHFDQYSKQELMCILQNRVRWAVRPDVVTESQLENIADAVAGDARVAIGILRNAAQNAAQTHSDAIDDETIEDAVSEAKVEIRQTNVEKLTDDQKIVYDIITEHGEIAPSELYEAYEQKASNPRSQRMVRNYLTKLCHYNLIEAPGKNRGRIYRSIQN
ncbi:Cdc6/Cdc18 family protein [Halobacteriaceae archaeon SHR40]|uniref:Cdc6/Cdc18 family protein n=1 Tax=Halovenus amylolytica TaxID=2500550 RepID=UPI000FE40B67